jgi:hypothetical protein
MSADAGTTQIYMPPREAVRHLVKHGVVHGLDDAALDELRQECWDGSEEQLEEAGLLGILTFYYESAGKGAADGFIWHAGEFWNDTDDVVAELAACVHDERPLFKQISAKERVSTARKFRETVLALVIERDDGVRKDVEARTLADVVAVFNAELKARGSSRRFVDLDTGGDDWLMYVCLELPLARKLVAQGALPVADLDALGD